jgi:cytochrome bd-type quinol oxidase subunit 2
MLEVLFELLFEFFGEFVLQLVFELFGGAFKAGWYKVTGRNKPSTVMLETGWAVVTGCVAGAVTVWLFPMLAIRLHWLQVLNLLVAPVAAGLLVERARAWRESRRSFSPPVFAYAALFGLAFALTRWLFGH